jgi:hypothetical protein
MIADVPMTSSIAVARNACPSFAKMPTRDPATRPLSLSILRVQGAVPPMARAGAHSTTSRRDRLRQHQLQRHITRRVMHRASQNA